MLRALIAGLKTALLAALEFAWNVVTLPLRAVLPPPAESATEGPPDVAADFEQLAEDDAARAPSVPDVPAPVGDNAIKIMRWSAETIHGRVASAERIAMALPTGLRTWTTGLTVDHARAMLKSGLTAMSAHIGGEALIDGVPAVRRNVARPAASITVTADHAVSAVPPLGHALSR